MGKLYHGGNLENAMAIYGGRRQEWLDLSTGINPNSYPFSPVADVAWSRLPDSLDEQNLLAAARDYYSVQKFSQIIAANGTQAILEILPEVISVKRVVILSPTYGEHTHVWQKAGADVTRIYTLEELPKNTDLLVVVNPNNPDGRIWKREALVEAAAQVKHLIVDEAFGDVAPQLGMAEVLPENAIVLRSFGKFFGLAGLRLGFAICNPDIASSIENRLGPWAVSGPALKIGAQAFKDASWIVSTRKSLEINAEKLTRCLTKNGLTVEGACSLFVFVRHNHATKLFEHLALHQILVRPFEEMPDKLRFGLCGNSDELTRLDEVLASFE